MNMKQMQITKQISVHELAESIRRERQFALIINLRALEALKKLGEVEA